LLEPCDLDAVAARRAIGARELSPVELVRSCIARIEAVDPAVNAMVARDFERALTAARAAERALMNGAPLGPLHGLPLGVKDLVDAAGLPTTFGSALFRDNVAAADEGVVARLRAAGAIVLGKTNTPEWGAGGNTRNALHGATGNPHDPTRSAAGSSGGSAAALACGMVPLATGSDTAGSLRTPAAYCGIVGFRPTPGLIPSERRNMAWIPLSTLGPMARTVPDLDLMLGAMAGHDARDPLNVFAGERRSLDRSDPFDLRQLRIAASPDLGFALVEPGIRATFGDKLQRVAGLFGDCRIVHPDCSGADEAFEVLRAVLFLGRHRSLLAEDPQHLGATVAGNVEAGLRYTAVDVAQALEAQTALYRRWQTFFAETDLLLTPAVTVSPRAWREPYPASIDGRPTRTYFHWLALAYAVTLAGHPALSLPLGRDHAGMPFGLQIVGPRGGDARVLAAAAALEERLAQDPDLARPRPDLDALRRAPALASMPGFSEPI